MCHCIVLVPVRGGGRGRGGGAPMANKQGGLFPGRNPKSYVIHLIAKRAKRKNEKRKKSNMVTNKPRKGAFIAA